MREAIQYRNSRDPKVVAAGVEMRTGKKWNAKRDLQVAEERLRHKAIVGSVERVDQGWVTTPAVKSQKLTAKNINISSKEKYVLAWRKQGWVRWSV